MSKYLVIVESPAKSKTIEKYLGSDYQVVASMGHIRNLANSGKFGLGIDVENEFKPTYEAIKGKGKVITALKKDVKNNEFVYLATDPDREGEAISWHLKEALNLKKYARVEFNEITKPVVTKALNEPREIDYNLVKSQETRMMLDKIIGFRLSKLMQYKTSGKSAGRVQSVAVKLIVDREREIEAFDSKEYWTITSNFDSFEANLEKYKDTKLEINNEEEADSIISKLSDEYKVIDITKKEINNLSKPVFKTSTLQQVAGNKIGFPAKKTMSVAQKLYEGINIGSETTGLITYMRTDSERTSPLFIDATFKFIEEKYGKEYVGFVRKQKKNENMQDAHEGIRPTDITRTPESIKSYLTPDEYKLYNLIYKRALGSLMASSKSLSTSVSLLNNDYLFKATGSIVTFDGYLKIYDLDDEDDSKSLPNINLNDIYKTDDVIKKQHFTEPPARFTEASLIKEMESLGIGRPSTYATIVTTIKDRGYVILDKKKFVPTELGFETNDKLQNYFANIINVKYTADMETDLDEIAEGKLDNIKTLKDFYSEFEPLVEKAFGSMEKTAPKETGEKCPNCGSPLVIRKGKYGEFTACSNYPTCKYIKKEEHTVNEIIDCPNCDGKIIEKHSKKGKVFYGCNNYPKCKTAYWDKPIGEKCPNCGEMLVEHGKTIKCSSCDYVK